MYALSCSWGLGICVCSIMELGPRYMCMLYHGAGARYMCMLYHAAGG